MELALTARSVAAAEAKAMGLVSEVCENVEALEARAMQLASVIACKSPIAVTGTKRVLQHARCDLFLLLSFAVLFLLTSCIKRHLTHQC